MFGGFMHVMADKKKFELVECNDFFSRFKGFMFTKNIDYCLKFAHCNSIHTFFMYESIDVVMTDIDNKVLYIFRNVKPWRVILPKKNVYNVFEFPSGSIKSDITSLKVVK